MKTILTIGGVCFTAVLAAGILLTIMSVVPPPTPRPQPTSINADTQANIDKLSTAIADPPRATFILNSDGTLDRLRVPKQASRIVSAFDDDSGKWIEVLVSRIR